MQRKDNEWQLFLKNFDIWFLLELEYPLLIENQRNRTCCLKDHLLKCVQEIQIWYEKNKNTIGHFTNNYQHDKSDLQNWTEFKEIWIDSNKDKRQYLLNSD